MSGKSFVRAFASFLRIESGWSVCQPLRWRDRRQALPPLKAEATGYQLKKSAEAVLPHIKTEPFPVASGYTVSHRWHLVSSWHT